MLSAHSSSHIAQTLHVIKVGDLLQPVAKIVGDVTRDLHKLIDPKVSVFWSP